MQLYSISATNNYVLLLCGEVPSLECTAKRTIRIKGNVYKRNQLNGWRVNFRQFKNISKQTSKQSEQKKKAKCKSICSLKYVSLRFFFLLYRLLFSIKFIWEHLNKLAFKKKKSINRNVFFFLGKNVENNNFELTNENIHWTSKLFWYELLRKSFYGKQNKKKKK